MHASEIEIERERETERQRDRETERAKYDILEIVWTPSINSLDRSAELIIKIICSSRVLLEALAFWMQICSVSLSTLSEFHWPMRRGTLGLKN